MPVAGGIARYTHITHGSVVSFIMSWLAWLSCVAVAPTEVQAILQYATHYYPWLTHSVDSVVVLTLKGMGGDPVVTASFGTQFNGNSLPHPMQQCH